MNLIVTLLLIVTGLWVLVRLLEARSRLALGLLVALLLVVFARWSQQATNRPLGNAATYAAASDSDSILEPTKDEPVATASSEPEQAGDSGVPNTADADEVMEATAEPAPDTSPEDAAADLDDLQIELTAEAGNPIRPEIPAAQAWVDSPPDFEGQVHTIAVSSGPCNTPPECRDALAAQLEATVDTYVDWYLGKVYGDSFKASQFVDFDSDYVLANLVNPRANPDSEYEEVIQHSFGPMHQKHALVKFGPEFRQLLDSRRAVIDQRWRQMHQTGRVLAAALGFGLILAFLGVVFGYFRLDTATRGYYTGRLQFVSVVAILAVVVAGFLLAQRVPWM